MLEKKLKLFTTKSETNMWLFDKNQRLKKYDNVKEIATKSLVKVNDYMMSQYLNHCDTQTNYKCDLNL